MAYSDIVNVSISLDIATVSRAGFGIILFAGDHVWFTERTRSYNSLVAAAEDLPTDSNEFKALTQGFSPDIKPSQIKVGRRDVDTLTVTPDAVTAVGQVYKLSVKGTDGVTIDAEFITVTGSETAADITADLTTDLTAIVGVTVVDGTGTLDLSKSGTEAYAVTTITRYTHSAVSTETAADMMAAITEVDDDFFFVASNDHTDAFILALAANIETRTKIYFVSAQDVTNLDAFSDTATDTFAKLKQGGFFRTTAWYHDTADTTFPEMNYAAIAAPSDPGKKIWANNRVSGSTAAKDISTGLLLSITQKSNLNDKNANYTEVVGGLTITRRGTVSGNASFLISLIRNRDFLQARLTENYQNFLINRPVVPYTDSGITSVEAVLTSTLSRYVETKTQPNILQENNPFTTNFPQRKDVSFSDVANGTFTGSFTAFLSGAIREIVITGSLTFEASS